jgi:hypothetical protein
MNSLLAALPWPRDTGRSADCRRLCVVDIELPDAPDDGFCRCGWFDSSLALADGLLVIEHSDAWPDGLPIAGLH